MPFIPSDYVLESLFSSSADAFSRGYQQAKNQRLLDQINQSKADYERFRATSQLQALIQSLEEQPGEVKTAKFTGDKAEEDYLKAIALRKLEEGKLGTYRKYGDQQALAKLEAEQQLGRQRSNAADLSSKQLSIADRFGVQEIKAKIAADRALTQQRRSSDELTRSKIITEKQQRNIDQKTFETNQRKTELETKVKQREEELAQKIQLKRSIFNLISPFDLTTEQGVAAAVGTLQGAGLPEDQIKAFQVSPTKYKEFLYTSLVGMSDIAQERLANVRAANKSKGKKGSTEPELVEVESHEYNTLMGNVKLKFANAFYNDPSVVYEGTPNYTEMSGNKAVGLERASLISALASNTLQYAQTHSTDKTELYTRMDRYSDLAVEYFNNAVGMFEGDTLAAIRAIPDNPQQFAAINQQVNNIDVPGTAAYTFNSKVLSTPELNDLSVQQSLQEEGLAVGLDPYTVSIIINDAISSKLAR